jgi:magnesium transporter
VLTVWTVENGACTARDNITDHDALRRAVWIDLVSPTQQEEHAVQEALGLEIPTREEMSEIESSSRLYREGDTLFLTANFLYGVDSAELGSTPITFVLGNHSLVTVRYATPKAFTVFAARAQRQHAILLSSPDAVMLHLFEQVVDRIADILEKMAADMEAASRAAFRAARTGSKASQTGMALKETLLVLGAVGDVTTRASETLLGVTRILTFVGAEKAAAVRKENQPLMKSLVRDVRSLVEHAGFLNNKAQFLLDAVLGIINVEQTAIIKTFSVVSVALMPPTLIASIYGMNFEHMPELGWPIGYPLALLAMICSAVLPVMYFRRKGWL